MYGKVEELQSKFFLFHLLYLSALHLQLMGQKKLLRFREIKTFPNVLEYPENIKGNWNGFFQNRNRITVELACGKGEYTTGMATLYPLRNFIGVDIKGNRIWRGAKTAVDGSLNNVAFLRTEIGRITNYFARDEVDEIWITFPDPQLRLSRIKKRLTHPSFLRQYKQCLSPDGLVNLKTDSPEFYRFTRNVINLYNLELLADYENLYNQESIPEELLIQTHYEGLDIAKSKRVHYLQFRINKELPLEKDAELKNLFREEQPS